MHVNSASSTGRMAVRDRYTDIKEKLHTEMPVIVDGGANNGSTIELFLKQYKFPTIHAYEPIPELVDKLKKRFEGRNNIIIHDSAIGSEKKTIVFNIVNNLVSSSVFEPSSLNKNLHGENVRVVKKVEVKQVRLEEELKSVGNVDLLKLDLQGYELEALRGCGALLNRVKIITTEIEFVPLYDDQPLFGDIDIYLRTHGFKLLNLYELYTHPDGQLTAGDAVYLNRRYY